MRGPPGKIELTPRQWFQLCKAAGQGVNHPFSHHVVQQTIPFSLQDTAVLSGINQGRTIGKNSQGCCLSPGQPGGRTTEIAPGSGLQPYHIPAKGCIPGIYSKNFRSEEHTSELQSLMRISYAVFCLKQKKTQ